MDRDTEFAEYAREQWSTLVRSAVFLGCQYDEAQDQAQTTLVKCYKNWDKVTGADNQDAYVYRMLLNTIRDRHRSRWWRSERPAEHLPERPVADRTEAIATTDAIHRALDTLSKVNRDVVVLRYFAQLTEQQTAVALDIAAGTVKSRLSRALSQLAADKHLADLKEGTL